MDNFFKNTGKFQANVGYFAADWGLITAYIGCAIMIIVAIVMAYLSNVPLKPLCSVPPQPQCNPDMIKLDASACEEETKRCNTKKKYTWFLWFLLLIPLGIGWVFLNTWWKKFVNTNKTAAQIGGTMFEISMAKRMIL